MKKEKKITIKHFENTNVKKVSYKKESFHPLYFQIVFDRQNYKYKCPFDIEYLKFKFSPRQSINKQVESKNWEAVKSELIRHNEFLIDLIIKQIKNENKEFDNVIFEKYYDLYSNNIFTIVDGFFKNLVVAFFKERKLHDLEYAIKINDSNIDFTLTLFENLNPTLYNDFLKKNWQYFKVLHAIETRDSIYITKKDELGRNEVISSHSFASYIKYMSIIEWEQEKKSIIETAINENFIPSAALFTFFEDNSKAPEVEIDNDKLELLKKGLKEFVRVIDKSIKKIKEEQNQN